jgi:hypothetical protein
LVFDHQFFLPARKLNYLLREICLENGVGIAGSKILKRYLDVPNIFEMSPNLKYIIHFILSNKKNARTHARVHICFPLLCCYCMAIEQIFFWVTSSWTREAGSTARLA